METTTSSPGITVDSFGNFRCTECARFVSASEQERGRAIKHARHCESQAQAVAAPAPVAAAPRDRFVARAAREGQAALVATQDEVVKAVRGKFLSVDDAMNQDF